MREELTVDNVVEYLRKYDAEGTWPVIGSNDTRLLLEHIDALRAAQQATVPDDNSYSEFIVVDANENETEASASGPRNRALSEAMNYARQYAEGGEMVVYELVEVARMDHSSAAQSAQDGK